MKRIIPLILLFLFHIYSCNTTEPPPPQQEQPKTVKLNLIETTCTEAFISVTAEDTILPINITLNRDENQFLNFTLTNPDTIIIDETVLPGKTYVYQTRSIINKNEEIGDTLQVRTFDTTSHNFSWQLFTFGDPETAGSSTLNDVAIINNEIWAVGEIYVNNSTGQPESDAYNAVCWDGSWPKINRIYYYGICSAIKYPPLKSIFEFSDNKTIVTNGGSVGWLNSDSVKLDCGVNHLLTGAINKIWGISSSDFYVVGDIGNIINYNISSWQKIEYGISEDLRDIWGTHEIISGVLKILAVATSINNYKILTINGLSAKDTLEWPTTRGLSGIWLDGIRTYACGTDIWINEKNIWRQATSTGYFFTSIKGSKCNNIYGIGPDGIIHFNGSTWHVIKQRSEGITLIAGDCTDNIVVAVGFTSNGSVVGKAAVLVGSLK